jgi:DNA-binding transcriptional LysR family regulator
VTAAANKLFIAQPSVSLAIRELEDELVLICGQTHSLSATGQADISKLPSYDFIMREKGSGGRELFESSMLVHGIEIKPVWESVSTRAIVKAVSEGLGLSVLPYQLIKQDLENEKIIRVKVEGLTLKRFYSLIYLKNKMHTKSAKDFMELCKNNTIIP